MNRLPSIHRQPNATRHSQPAFTLIELLVVITIIGILAALIVTAAGYAGTYARKTRVQAERNALVTAIEQYKQHKGYYPPDNPNGGLFLPPLYYELTGAVQTSGGFQGANNDLLTGGPYPSELYTVFGVQGIVNLPPEPGSAAVNFFAGAAKGARSCTYYVSGTSGATFTVFGVPVEPIPTYYLSVRTPGGAVSTNTLNVYSGTPVNPWHYVSTNPTNNPSEFDLWMDVTLGGKTNRISNWSPDPVPLN